jgi:predicted metal-dependent hydrolase
MSNTGDDEALIYTVERSRRRRTMALRVEPSGSITVYAPYFAWGYMIDRFVQRHREWILKKLAYFRDRPASVPVTQEERAQRILETDSRLKEVVTRLSIQMGVSPRSVKVAHQTSRWGSCSSLGNLRFSWRMARLPADVFDYVVIHELAHLRHMNHSPRFWAVVAAVCPDHKSHRRWLRKNDGPYFAI